MTSSEAFVDIHCHLLPSLDDGAQSWTESTRMAEIAFSDGIRTIIATPHQLGTFTCNDGDTIRRTCDELQSRLRGRGMAVSLLPGADVRIEEGMFDKLRRGEVLTLGDHGKHLLLELPHELYMPLQPVMCQARQMGVTAVLSHPERNQGLLARSSHVLELVDAGCLMQVTAGSLLGAFGTSCQQFAEWMLREGCVHFVATDAHGADARRPRMRQAHKRIAGLVSQKIADELCYHNPLLVSQGLDVAPGRRLVGRRVRRWFALRKTA